MTNFEILKLFTQKKKPFKIPKKSFVTQTKHFNQSVQKQRDIVKPVI